MKELVLQLSLLGLSPASFFFFISCQAPSQRVKVLQGFSTGGQELRLAGYFLYLTHSLGAIPFVCHPLSGPKEISPFFT